MSETLTNGVIVPDKGSRDWYADLRSNWLKLDSLIAGGNITVNPAQTKGILVATITVGGKEYKLYQQDGDVSVKIDPSAENAEYPLVASTSAEANTGSVVMAPAVTVNPSTGAVTATSFKGKLEGNASTATNATKAMQDGAGAVITDTYATKKELGSKADDANVVHKSGTETIVGTKTFSGDTSTKIVLQNTRMVNGQDDTVNRFWSIALTDKNNGQSARILRFINADNSSAFQLNEYYKGDSKNQVVMGPGHTQDGQGFVTWNAGIKNNTYPLTDNTYTLGTSELKWKAVYANSVVVDDKNVLTDANQIMLAQNLSGANITPGGVVDCGNGNGKLKLWHLGADGTFVLANTLPTGVWKSASFVTLAPNEGGMFIKIG